MNRLELGGGRTKDRKEFYVEFLDFVRRYPEMRMSLYVPKSDLNFLINEGCYSIACDLMDLCLSGRLALTRKMPRPDLMATLRALRELEPCGNLRAGRIENSTDSHPHAA